MGHPLGGSRPVCQTLGGEVSVSGFAETCGDGRHSSLFLLHFSPGVGSCHGVLAPPTVPPLRREINFRGEREKDVSAVVGATFWRFARGSAAACSRQSLVSSDFFGFLPRCGCFSATGREAIVAPCWGSCEPLPRACPPGAEGTESPVLTLHPRFLRQFQFCLAHCSCFLVRNGLKASISEIWANSWLLRG